MSRSSRIFASGTVIVITLIVFSIVGLNIQQQEQCPDPIGWAYVDSCIPANISPALMVGQTTTQCFYYKPITSYSTLGWIQVTSSCGPFAPYASLDYELFDQNCDSLIYSGTIYPVGNNVFIWLDTAKIYRVCYTWTALCIQWQACPIINPSFLPLTWLDVNGKYLRETSVVRVGWTTASEINCDYFIVQKMCGTKWCDLGRLKAKGGQTFSTVYIFDDGFVEENNYYRIRQVDYSGASTLSKVILVRVTNEANIDCYYMTMLGELISSDLEQLPVGIYIKRCQSKWTLVTITK
jgi:hypothetical protein